MGARGLWPLLLAAGATWGAGCAGPTHLGDGTTGRAARAVFTSQAAREPTKPPAVAATGLDSQEAAIVSEGYRRSLAPRGVAVEEPPVLFVAPSPAGYANTNPMMPPPSVPQGGK
ncbi:MAG: hypothetical protein HY901_26760 [Deltaproteobacteria bacterium]|nr:hypothetical protein [Deltaproteobacteria bacterium]